MDHGSYFLLSMFDFASTLPFALGKKRKDEEEERKKKCIPYAYSEQMRSFDYSITTFLTYVRYYQEWYIGWFAKSQFPVVVVFFWQSL